MANLRGTYSSLPVQLAAVYGSSREGIKGDDFNRYRVSREARISYRIHYCERSISVTLFRDAYHHYNTSPNVVFRSAPASCVYSIITILIHLVVHQELERQSRNWKIYVRNQQILQLGDILQWDERHHMKVPQEVITF